MPDALTPRQVQIMDFLRSTIAERGYPPTIREVGDAVGLNSSSVHNQLKRLQEKGHITKDPNRPRAITLADTPDTTDLPAAIKALAEEWEANGNSRELGDPSDRVWFTCAERLRDLLASVEG